MTERVTISHRFGEGVTWKEFPTLESIYEEMSAGGPAPCQKRYYDAVVAACEKEGATALAIELSVVDRESSVSDIVAFHTSFYRLQWAPITLILQNRGSSEDPSPYEAAMIAMTDSQAAQPAEPIVLHPGLRNPELLYLVSPPLVQECPPVPTKKYEMEPVRRWEATLLRSAETEVSSQVHRFRTYLQKAIADLDARYRSSSAEHRPLRLFDAATLVVVPFLRDPWTESAEETVGGFADFTTQAGGATGLVTFVWLVGPVGASASLLGKQVGNRIIELHRILTMKESLAKSNLLVRKNHFLHTAAHDIKNQINSLQISTLKSIFFPAGRDRISAERCTLFSQPEDWNVSSQNVQIIVDFARAITDTQGLVIGMLQGVELGTGPRKLRSKFQARISYTSDELLDHALAASNRWLERMNRSINLLRLRFPDEGDVQTGPKTILFPKGYYSLEIISTQIIEFLINAGKHGRVENEVATVHATFTNLVSCGRELFVLRLENFTRRPLAVVANKTSALNYAEGLDVKSELADTKAGQLYSVSLRFGPVPRELYPDGPLEIVTPGRCYQGG